MIARPPALALVLAALSGCQGGEDRAWVWLGAAAEYSNAVEPTEAVADAPLPLLARAYGGCDQPGIAVTCEVALDGDHIEVATEVSWSAETPSANPIVNAGHWQLKCESVLYVATAPCVTPDLPAGDYTVAYAGQTVDVTVPGTVDAQLPP